MSASSTCPVCGFPGMPEPASDYHICPCCGTEFGYDDFTRSHAHLRALWLQRGAPWFAPEYRPENWSALGQLCAAGLMPSYSSNSAEQTASLSQRSMRSEISVTSQSTAEETSWLTA